jgi:hypothetical protein
MAGINVPIGPATVEYGDGVDVVVFDITKGGIQFQSTTSKQDTTVDQYGDTIVKSITKGGTAQVTVPFALHDLEKLSAVIPNSDYVEDGMDSTKKKITVKSQAGFDLLGAAKKLIIKPTSAGTTANDWVTIPLAGVITDPQYTYDSDSERVSNITFTAFPDLDADGALYILGDETATA